MKRRPIDKSISRASRREFLRSSALAIGALSAGGRAVASVGMGNPGISGRFSASTPYVTVFDQRYEASVAFARRAKSLGLRTQGLDRGDVTDLWYHDLYHRWKIGPAAIAGLTTENALMVLEGFGNDAGLRRVFSAEHWSDGVQVVHRIQRPAGNDWAADMALLIGHCPLDHDQRVVERAATRSTATTASAPTRLVSWFLAPVRQCGSSTRLA